MRKGKEKKKKLQMIVLILGMIAYLLLPLCLQRINLFGFPQFSLLSSFKSPSPVVVIC